MQSVKLGWGDGDGISTKVTSITFEELGVWQRTFNKLRIIMKIMKKIQSALRVYINITFDVDY